MRGIDLYLFQFTKEFIELTSKDDRIERLHKKELIGSIIRTIMFNMDRYKSVDEIVKNYSQIILESNPEETNEVITRVLHELTYKVGLNLERLTTYFQIRQVVSSVLEKIGSYADDKHAAKFDRLSIKHKNQIRRMTEYDKQKLLKEISELSGEITVNYSPEELNEDKKRKKEETHSKELIHVINQKIDQIKEIFEPLIGNKVLIENNTTEIVSLAKNIKQMMEIQESLSERMQAIENTLNKISENLAVIKTSKKKTQVIKDDLTKTSEAMDKLDNDTVTENEDLYGKVDDVDSNEEEEKISEDDIKDSLSESLKDFLGKKK